MPYWVWSFGLLWWFLNIRLPSLEPQIGGCQMNWISNSTHYTRKEDIILLYVGCPSIPQIFTQLSAMATCFKTSTQETGVNLEAIIQT